MGVPLEESLGVSHVEEYLLGGLGLRVRVRDVKGFSVKGICNDS